MWLRPVWGQQREGEVLRCRLCFKGRIERLLMDQMQVGGLEQRRQWHPTSVLLPENPMGRGAWQAAVHGIAKSRTRLSDFTFSFHFHALEKEMATHSSVLAWRIPGIGEPGGLPSMGSHRVGHDWSDQQQQQQGGQRGGEDSRLFYHKILECMVLSLTGKGKTDRGTGFICLYVLWEEEIKGFV